MQLSLIVAVADNGVIGRQGQLPWHLPADLKRFKRLTMGHALLMGRRTYASIGRPLPGRTSIVITRDRHFTAAGCLIAHDWRTALSLVPPGQQTFVIGGREIFALALASAQRIYWTQVHAAVPGDVRFPPIDWSEWQLVQHESHPADGQHAYPFSFRVYDRATAAHPSGDIEGKGEDVAQ
jgi:dihydrofolate reductase